MDHIISNKTNVSDFVKKRGLDIGFLIAGIALGILFQWSIFEIAIFLVFIWSILGSIPSRYLAWPAIFFLVLTSIMLFLGKKELAEEYSIYTYYFLVMVVILGVIELRTVGGGKN